jgi:uncharacterized membrane protein
VTDDRDEVDVLERQLGRLLRAGVVLSSLALGVGLVVALVFGAGTAATNLLTLGVLLLIGTPVARVVVSSIAYARRRDWTFTLLTLIVLSELIASIVAAMRA